jgi:protein-tyrosine phosphatase
VTIQEVPSRHVELPNVFNLRDLGGYPAADGRTVAWRRLFRADGLQRLAVAEAKEFHALGLRTVIDLRRADEVARGRLQAEGLTYYNHSLQPAEWVVEQFDASMDPARYLAERYLEMTSQRGAEVASVLRLIADPTSAPLVFHCAAGKDRTGVVAALTLSLLGVNDDIIAEDYALSTESSRRWDRWAQENLPEVAAEVSRLPTPWTTAPPEAILHFLTGIRAEHGSVREYATSVGIDDDTLASLRLHLLSPATEGAGDGAGPVVDAPKGPPG